MGPYQVQFGHQRLGWFVDGVLRCVERECVPRVKRVGQPRQLLLHARLHPHLHAKPSQTFSVFAAVQRIARIRIDFVWEMSSRGNFATPADFLFQDRSPFRGLRVRRGECGRWPSFKRRFLSCDSRHFTHTSLVRADADAPGCAPVARGSPAPSPAPPPAPAHRAAWSPPARWWAALSTAARWRCRCCRRRASSSRRRRTLRSPRPSDPKPAVSMTGNLTYDFQWNRASSVLAPWIKRGCLIYTAGKYTRAQRTRTHPSGLESRWKSILPHHRRHPTAASMRAPCPPPPARCNPASPCAPAPAHR